MDGKNFEIIIGNVLREAGTGILREPRKFKAYLSDLSQGHEQEKQFLMMCADEKFLKMFSDGVENDPQSLARASLKAKEYLKSQYMTSEEGADMVAEAMNGAICGFKGMRKINMSAIQDDTEQTVGMDSGYAGERIRPQPGDRFDPYTGEPLNGGAGYGNRPGYQPGAGFQDAPGYQGDPRYQGGPSYQGDPRYQGNPSYQGGPGYQDGPRQQAGPGYQSGPGQPHGYRVSPAYQGASYGAAAAQQKGNNKKFIPIIAAIIVVAIVAIAAIVIHSHNNDDESGTSSTTQSESSDTSSTQSEATDHNDTSQDQSGATDSSSTQNDSNTSSSSSGSSSSGTAQENSSQTEFLGVSSSNRTDYNLVLDGDSYLRYEDGDFYFRYPKDFYTSAKKTVSNGVTTYSFEGNDGVTDLRFEKYKANGNAEKVIRNLKKSAAGELYTVDWSYPDADNINSVKVEKDGSVHGIVTGYATSAKNSGGYYYFACDDGKVYTMTVHNPVENTSMPVGKGDYLVDCLYRGFSRSNATNPIRSYNAFLDANR